MERKEHYRQQLPHFQQPGQAYFVTWCLKDAVPPKALIRYSDELSLLKSQLSSAKEKQLSSDIIKKLQQEYYVSRRKYIKSFDDLLDNQKSASIDLSALEVRNIVKNALLFFEGKCLQNYAFCVMPNHVHWVLELYKEDETGKLVFLQDVLQSVKRFSATQINKLENRKGAVWQKESFETTIRNHKHLYYAIEYTLNNPIKAGLVKNREDWAGSWNTSSASISKSK